VFDVDILSMMVAMGIAFAMFITSCKPVEPLVQEHECAIKEQLFSAGLRPSVYFFSSLFVSTITLLVVVVEALICLLVLRLQVLSGQILLAFVIGSIICAVALSAFNYSFGGFFKNKNASTMWLSLTLIALAGLPYLLKLLFVLVPQIVNVIGIRGEDAVFLVCELFVPFSFLEFLFALCGMPAGTSFSAAIGVTSNAFRPLVMMAADTVIYSLLAIALEMLKDRILLATRPPAIVIEAANEDEDVARERQRVESDQKRDVVSCIRLRKEFGRLVAVQNLSMGIPANEVFGLLGPNAQGKTTTVNMLLGLLQPTSGIPMLNGVKLQGFRTEVHAAARLGSCPQSGGLLGYLTGREHLEIFARVRSQLSANQAKIAACRLLVALGMEQHADKQVKAYSGGTMRKCSAAIALLPGTRMVVLDEPSTGLDVLARRALWSQVRRARGQRGGVVLLTTHSMEEAESACTSVGIIDHGALVCIGTVQHLKSRFSSGYNLMIELASGCDAEAATRCDALATAAANTGKLAALTDVAGCRRTYNLGHPPSLAHIFAVLEEARAASTPELPVRNYTIQQASLENVFARVVKKISEQP